MIESLPGVLEAGVVGIPHEKDMYHPMALVVKRNGFDITEEEIISLVRGELLIVTSKAQERRQGETGGPQ